MRLRTVWQFPLLHFLLLGSLFYLVQPLLPVPAGSDWALQTIHVSEAELQRLRLDWRRETGRMPNAAELRSSIQQHVDSEILLREALKRNLHLRDPVARERLLANMHFAFPDSTDDDAALLAQAEALGMQARDLVVRRRLIQLMQMRLASDANFTEAELRDFITQHSERYGQANRYEFHQLFIDGDRPAAEAEKRAAELLATLQGDKAEFVNGDPFLLGNAFTLRTEADIARQFGPDFAQAITKLKPGTWAGPLRSPYGLHLVKVERVETGAPPDYEQVKQRAAYALLSEKESQVLRDELARLRLRYRVEMPQSDNVTGIAVGDAP